MCAAIDNSLPHLDTFRSLRAPGQISNLMVRVDQMPIFQDVPGDPSKRYAVRPAIPNRATAYTIYRVSDPFSMRPC